MLTEIFVTKKKTVEKFKQLSKMPHYAVRYGHRPGVYSSWDEAKIHVMGFNGAVHKKFNTALEAAAFIGAEGGYSKTHTSRSNPRSENSSRVSCNFPDSNIKMDDENFSTSLSDGRKRSIEGASSSASSLSPHELVMYTDGACKGNQNVRDRDCPAGWGVVLLSSRGDVIAEMYAPVELNSSSRDFLGADVKSNNTAELTAIGESLRFLRDKAQIFQCSCSSVACCCSRPSVAMRYDSEYAAKTVYGAFNGEKNKELYLNIRKIYNEVIKGGKYTEGRLKGQQRRPINVIFEKVKGHSGDKWNDRADFLANQGAKGLFSEATCLYNAVKGDEERGSKRQRY